jgi:hypothetical protein
MILVVTYELKQPVESYTPLFEALKNEESWAHYMSSTWLVATHQSPNSFGKSLVNLIFEGDRLLVTGFSPSYYGWLPQKAWDWIGRYKESD